MLVAEQEARRLDAVQVRHPHIHEHDVGLQLASEPDRVGAVDGLPDDVDARVRPQKRSEPGPHHGLVVRDQHTYLHPASLVSAWASGSTARTS